MISLRNRLSLKDMEKTAKILFKGLYYLVLALLIFIGGLIALSAISMPNGLRLFTVRSGSMNPTISVGSVVVVRPHQNYQKGDIITYKRAEDTNIDNPAITTTHRIVEVIKKEQEIFYSTKGDANNAPDGKLTPDPAVIGKVVFQIPFIGYPVDFAKKPVGFVVMIVIPATIIIYDEIISIKREVVKILQRKNAKKNK